jgi:hypothetical protein
MADDKMTVAGVNFVLPATARRDFIKMLGLAGVAVCAPPFLAAACNGSSSTGPAATGITLDFSTDIGVLNYAYALEQLEAAFYTQVVAAPYSGMPAAEAAVLGDIKVHEQIHRDFLKAALGASAIPLLATNFASINFADRTSVLTIAKTLEDTGVSAYNGAASHIQSATYLTLAGKIVSVEGRHASTIRDLLMPRTAYFAGDDVVVASTGLDASNPPSVVLSAADAGQFIKNTITVTNF